MIRRVLALGLFVLPGCAAAPMAAAPPAPPPAYPPGPLGMAPPAAPRPVVAPAPSADEGYAAAAAAADGEDTASLDDDIDEEAEALAPAPTRAPQPPRSPLLALSDTELAAKYKQDPASLGPISAGRAGAGVLVNGVQMPKSDQWILLDPGRAYGTAETVDALTRIIGRVNERYPGTAPLPIGHLSAQRGGHLNPHVSHQSGRDADVGYYYQRPLGAFITATAANLDPARTWALVKAAIRETDVEMILMDRSIQRILVDYAALNGEDPVFLDEVFQIRNKNARAPIRHIKGHANHLHFRFHNPVAEELGRRLAHLISIPRIPRRAPASPVEVAGGPGTSYAQHRARSGDTLVILAKRYGCSVEDIQRANGLRSIALKAGTVYRIPQRAPLKAAAPAAHGPHKGIAAGAHKGAAPPQKAAAAPHHHGKPGPVAKKNAPAGKHNGAGKGASAPSR